MNTQSAPPAKVIDRLRKLLALANDKRANEAESQLAMEHAQQLMLEHNLTMATVEARGGEKEVRLKEETKKNLMFKWQRELFENVARVNFCFFSLVRKETASGERIVGGYEIIGRQSNVVSARNMYEYLAETIARLVKQECGPSSAQQFSKYANSFRLGCVDRLSSRLRERYDEKIEAQSRMAREANAAGRHPASTSNALVIVMDDYIQQEKDLNNDIRWGYEPGTTTRSRKEQELKSLQATARREAKQAEFMAQGIAEAVAYFMACGYSQEKAERMAAPEKPETEAQRRKREARDARELERWRARNRREAHKIDDNGYQAGQRSGDTVGLDDQIDRKSARQLV